MKQCTICKKKYDKKDIRYVEIKDVIRKACPDCIEKNGLKEYKPRRVSPLRGSVPQWKIEKWTREIFGMGTEE